MSLRIWGWEGSRAARVLNAVMTTRTRAIEVLKPKPENPKFWRKAAAEVPNPKSASSTTGSVIGEEFGFCSGFDIRNVGFPPRFVNALQNDNHRCRPERQRGRAPGGR